MYGPTHRQLLDLLREFNYPTPKGVCFGVSIRGMQAVFSDELEKFDNRLEYLADKLEVLTESELKKAIDSVEKKRVEIIATYKKELLKKLDIDDLKDSNFYELIKSKKYKKNPHVIEFNEKYANINDTLTDEERMLLDIHAFLDNVIVSYYASNELSFLYKKKHQVPYQDIEISFKHSLSHKLVKKAKKTNKILFKLFKSRLGERSLLKRIKQTTNGLYLGSELKDYFIELKKISTSFDRPVCYFLYNKNHAITVFYADHCWKMIDANHLPTLTFKTEKELAKGIRKAFGATDALVMRTDIVCEKNISKALKKELKIIKAGDKWRKLHTVKGKDLLQDKVGNTLSFSAARYGDLDLLKQLEECKSFDVNAHENNGLTLLNTAIMYGRENIVEYLLKKYSHQIDFTIPTAHERTVLVLAAESGNFNILKMLLNCKDHTFHPDHTLANVESPLQIAAQRGDLEMVQFLLSKGATPQFTLLKNKETAMHYAMENGHFDVVMELIKKGGSIYAESKYNETPLMFAVQKKQVKLMKKLLRDKNIWIDPTHIVNGASLLEVAARAGDVDMLTLLFNSSAVGDNSIDPGKLLYYAAKHGHIDALKFLLENKNFQNNDEDDLSYSISSALFGAVRSDRPDILGVLLRNNLALVDPHIRSSSEGYTPFEEAIIEKKHTMVRIFLLASKNFNINQVNHKNKTALYRAVQNDDLEMVQLLISYNADPNIAENERGYTPLHIAIKNKNLAIISALLKCENPAINLNIKAIKNNMTPLCLAALIDSKITEMLLNKIYPSSVDPFIESEGFTPLCAAAFFENYDSVITIMNNINYQKHHKKAYLDVMNAISSTIAQKNIKMLKILLNSPILAQHNLTLLREDMNKMYDDEIIHHKDPEITKLLAEFNIKLKNEDKNLHQTPQKNKSPLSENNNVSLSNSKGSSTSKKNSPYLNNAMFGAKPTASSPAKKREHQEPTLGNKTPPQKRLAH